MTFSSGFGLSELTTVNRPWHVQTRACLEFGD